MNRAASDEIIWHCKSGVLDTLGLVKEIDLGSTSIFTGFSLLGGDIIGYHFDIDPTFMINVASGDLVRHYTGRGVRDLGGRSCVVEKALMEAWICDPSRVFFFLRVRS